MLRTVAVLLFGLAVVSAQVNQGKPDAVIVKKIYGNPPAAAFARQGGFIQQSAFVPGPTPVPVPIQYSAQPYPYYNYNYNQNYYNQYRGAYPGYYPGYQAVAPSPVPVYASPAPPPAPVAISPVKVQPQPQFIAGKSGVADKEARILSEENKVDFDGTFKYAYQTDNGISVNAEGFVKQPTAESEGPIQVIQGTYTSYTPEGVPVSISYIADENGYRASGDAIPTPYPELAQAYANAPIEQKQRK